MCYNFNIRTDFLYGTNGVLNQNYCLITNFPVEHVRDGKPLSIVYLLHLLLSLLLSRLNLDVQEET